MQIAIIGAGNVGRALATSLTRAGHDVTITAEHAANAVEAASQSGATAGTSNQAAAAGADVVVLAVQSQAIGQIAADMGSSLDGKVVIDVSNRPTPTADGASTSIAEELQTRLPAARIVKAFNTVFASRQASPTVAGISPDGFVAGDDASAKQTVLDVVESIGFRPVDAGSLASARTLEGMAWLNIQRNLTGGTWQDAWILVGPESVAALTAEPDSRN
jgi:8-hydroxy-5-deazaflavin:NADPH oxidoreductase